MKILKPYHSFRIQEVYFFFWLCRVACGILVQPPGIEPGPSAVRAQSPKHWTAREFPRSFKTELF